MKDEDHAPMKTGATGRIEMGLPNVLEVFLAIK
jgi:hypothetical protein